jgi:hypothetical protein
MRPLAIVVVPGDQLAFELLLLAGQPDPGILSRKILKPPAVVLLAQRARTAHCDKRGGGNDQDEGTHKDNTDPSHDQPPFCD